MKKRILFISGVAILMLLMIYSSNAYSQPESSSTDTSSVNNNMTCSDLIDYFADYPDINCNINEINCEDCLGSQVDIVFDTTVVVTDNQIDEKCILFYTGVVKCLQKIRKTLNNEADITMIMNLQDPDLPIEEKLKNRISLILKYKEMQKLNKMLFIVNEKLIEIARNMRSKLNE